MRLSWNEVRARSATFARDWKDAAYQTSETQSFYNDFFAVFGVQRRTVARYEQHVAKIDSRSGFIDLFWPGVLIVEQTGRRRLHPCPAAGNKTAAARGRLAIR